MSPQTLRRIHVLAGAPTIFLWVMGLRFTPWLGGLITCRGIPDRSFFDRSVFVRRRGVAPPAARREGVRSRAG
jgi:hypothetical protein